MESDHLRRYTDLPAVLQILSTCQITLLPPITWDDRNDRNLMAAYQQRKGLKTLLALCFAQAPETYHHWKVFTSASSGMCIVFKRPDLITALTGSGVEYGSVEYLTIAQLRGGDPQLDRIPYSKRAAYRDEREFRLLYSSKDEVLQFKTVPVPFHAIDRVLINPWLPATLADTLKATLRRIPKCQDLPVLQSTVIDGPAWKALAGRVIQEQ